MKNIYLSVIIPCYNEKENIQRGVLNEVRNYLIKKDFLWEVIISDDESTDGSWDLVEKFVQKNSGFTHLKNKHGGKPAAVRSGIEASKGEWVLFTDMDQATPINQLEKMLPLFNNNDVVIGSRGMIRKNFPLYRKLSSIIFLNFRRLLLLHGIKDTQCGFKAFKRKVALELFPLLQFFRVKNQVSGWRVSAYDVELLFLTEKYHYRMAEVPVVWEDTDISKGKKRSFVKESKEMLFEIIRVRLNDIRKEYDK